jgi:hypothetical protein
MHVLVETVVCVLIINYLSTSETLILPARHVTKISADYHCRCSHEGRGTKHVKKESVGFGRFCRKR